MTDHEGKKSVIQEENFRCWMRSRFSLELALLYRDFHTRSSLRWLIGKIIFILEDSNFLEWFPTVFHRQHLRNEFSLQRLLRSLGAEEQIIFSEIRFAIGQDLCGCFVPPSQPSVSTVDNSFVTRTNNKTSVISIRPTTAKGISIDWVPRALLDILCKST